MPYRRFRDFRRLSFLSAAKNRASTAQGKLGGGSRPDLFSVRCETPRNPQDPS